MKSGATRGAEQAVLDVAIRTTTMSLRFDIENDFWADDILFRSARKLSRGIISLLGLGIIRL